MNSVTAESLDLVKACWAKPLDANPLDAPLAKSFTTGTGLNAYDLQPKALKLYPVITPLRINTFGR